MMRKRGSAGRKLRDWKKVAEGALLKRLVALFAILFGTWLLLATGSAKVPWYAVVLAAALPVIWLSYDIYSISKTLKEKPEDEDGNST